MKLCDECIGKLAAELSNQAEAIFENIFPILNQGKGLTKREIARLARLNRSATNYLLRELESSLVVAYQFQGRNKVYYLTETGKRLLELEKEEANSKEKEEKAESNEEVTEEVEEVEVEDLTSEIEKETNKIIEEEVNKIRTKENNDKNEEIEDNSEETSEVKENKDTKEETTNINSNDADSKPKDQELNWSMFE
ncbi:replication-relaxation family protein [Natroniella sulfidigena]|uniref:replication-relaxation family protein n=1 Tax=Natroniella sulfidigena TaxID=723921 RepID=UPI00200B1BAB|nr:replication-relaxation family protein [Natroniella sulfidigena]MCK8817325.1 replication-relaxation family protein [Natroniella sulfidigena]